MEKLKCHTPDLTADNIQKLAALFPNCLVEAKDAQGKPTKAIDFDQLRQELSTSVVEGSRERFHLDWPGKREALLAANAPIAKTLRPCREESVDFDTTKNLFIEGDNLDALKLLQETYLGKVKMIYIDPPYNTGNDFVYSDDFSEDTETYLLRSNQSSESGGRLLANTESNGRFHSDWLSMLYSRLKLARNLMREDGVIFVTIDDHEVATLRVLCDEIFGRENALAILVWQHSVQPKGYSGTFSVHHNFILCYQRSADFELADMERTDEHNRNYSNPDNDLRGAWRSGDVRNALYRPNLIYPIETPSGKTISPPPNGWRWSKETVKSKIATGEIIFSADESRIIRKIYLETLDGRTPETILFGKDVGTTRDAASEVKDLFGGQVPFDTPKPTSLIQHLIGLAGVQANDLVFDFFAGSGTTGEALWKAAAKSNQNYRLILVQLPELLNPEAKQQKLAADICDGIGIPRTIAELTKERLRRAGARIKTDNATTAADLDVGFRVLKIDASNMKDVYYAPDAVKQSDLVAHADNIKEGRTPEDILFQVLVDWGVDLALPIAKETIAGKTVFFVDGNALAACFDASISEEIVKELAKRKPLRAVFRDSSYGSDSVKINVEQIFKLLSPTTEIKSL